MSPNVVQALEEFMQRYLVLAESHSSMLMVEYDAQWPSDCYTTSEPKDGLVNWQPVKRQNSNDFSELAKALEMPIHTDVVGYYTAFWSDNLNAKTDKGQLQLLQAWNQQDFERLQQNLVGHILMKRRLKQPETVFFALTDEEDFIISIENQTGEVVLEQVGLLPQEVLAPNLTDFLQALQPLPISD